MPLLTPTNIKRSLSAYGLCLFLSLFSTHQSLADENKWHHGDTLFGELKYSENFKHYEHANPNAPKGGTLKRTAFGGYDSFNPFIVRGRPPTQLSYFGGLLYDTMMEQSRDQPSASYGLVAEAFRKADDYSWAVYRINEKATWHDGNPITPEDVIWSMETLRKTYPLWTQYFQNVESVTKTGEHEVTFKFDQTGNRELPHIIGDLVVLPKHWWTGIDKDGKKRDITKPTSEPPLGSGPYKIGAFEMGKYITYDRAKDYWGQDLPVRKGRFNYDHIRYSYFLTETAMWEAFKKGKIADYMIETDEQRWVKEYNFNGVAEGNIEKITFPVSRGQTFSGFFFNTRLDKFKDPRVRQAISILLDFDTINKTLFYDLQKRTDSFFEAGELESFGIPQGRELEILDAYRDKLPPKLFTETFKLADYSKPANKRQNQRQALKLFAQAGYKFNANKQLVNKNGEVLTVEFITNSQESERYTLPYTQSLKRLGINASLRVLDTAQFKSRTDSFDFDMVSLVTAQSSSPGNEQRDYWSTSSANREGSRNYAGISAPFIDELIEKIILAPNREELVSLTHALDRILKWGYYAVPQWHVPEVWFAKWRHIQVPLPQPTYLGVDTLSFWIDTEIERELTTDK